MCIFTGQAADRCPQPDLPMHRQRFFIQLAEPLSLRVSYSLRAASRSSCDFGSFSQCNGTKSLVGLTHEGLRKARIMKGSITNNPTPPNSTLYHTVVEPIAIWLGGKKLKTNASSEPANPTPAIVQIRAFPCFPIRERAVGCLH